MALPRDSYLQAYYGDVLSELRVGPPLMLVVRGLNVTGEAPRWCGWAREGRRGTGLLLPCSSVPLAGGGCACGRRGGGGGDEWEGVGARDAGRRRPTSCPARMFRPLARWWIGTRGWGGSEGQGLDAQQIAHTAAPAAGYVPAQP